MNTLLTIDHLAALNQICSYVYQEIIAIQEQEPELLLERYRNLQWRDSRYQFDLTAKLTERLSHAQGWDALVQKLQRFLQALLSLFIRHFKKQAIPGKSPYGQIPNKCYC